MNKKKWRKLVGLTLAAGLLGAALAGCGASGSDNASSASGEGSGETVKLGVTGAVYEDIWQPAIDKLADEGINVELVQFSDYTTPNNALANGDIDLNAFQHEIFLNDEVEKNGYKIQPIGYTFIIPLNLYSDSITSLDELKDGDTIAIPNDVTNGGRALKVLESAGLLTLDPAAGENPTVDDVTDKKVDFEIKELAANTIPSTLPDVTAGIVNGNFALDYDLDPDKALFKDTGLDDENYWNLIAARTEDLQDADKRATYKKIVQAFQSDETKAIFEDSYNGYFVPVGWDQDLLADK